MALSMSAVAIVSVIKDVLENGFLVIGMGRNIPLIGIDNEEGFMSATLITTKLLFLLSFLGFIFIPLGRKNKERYRKICYTFNKRHRAFNERICLT